MYDHHSGYQEACKGEKQSDKFKDVFWGVLFFIHLGIMVIAGVTYIPQLEAEVRNHLESNYGYNYQNANANGNGNANATSSGYRCVLSHVG